MRKIFILIAMLFLAASLTGCGGDSLGDYKKAAEKTEQIKMGQTSGEFSLVTEFNDEGMTAEEIKELNYYKDMKGSFSTVYDQEEEMSIFRNYLNLGGLGIDFELFIKGDEVIMKLPVAGKYMRLKEIETSLDIGQKTEEKGTLISRKTQDELNGIWLGLLTKDDVFKGKNIVLTTPDGEVKTTEYTINLNDEQIKSMAADSIEVLLKDENLKESFDQYIKKKADSLQDSSLEKLLSDMKKEIMDCTVESFNYTAYVDIDGYIVNEMFALTVKIESPEKFCPTSFSFKLNIKNWDLNQKQRFDFPVITEENTVDMDDMGENMPFMMEDIFKKKD